MTADGGIHLRGQMTKALADLHRHTAGVAYGFSSASVGSTKPSPMPGALIKINAHLMSRAQHCTWKYLESAGL